MDILSNLKFAEGSVKKRKRIARGQGSGRGGTSTKGMNGQKSRSGFKYRAWFEGGQMPLQRRVPKRGFTNIFKVKYQIVNLSDLQTFVEKFDIKDEEINDILLYKNGIISKATAPYKVLGNGEIKSKINVAAHKFSASAKEKIEAAGGTIKEI